MYTSFVYDIGGINANQGGKTWFWKEKYPPPNTPLLVPPYPLCVFFLYHQPPPNDTYNTSTSTVKFLKGSEYSLTVCCTTLSVLYTPIFPWPDIFCGLTRKWSLVIFWYLKPIKNYLRTPVSHGFQERISMFQDIGGCLGGGGCTSFLILSLGPRASATSGQGGGLSVVAYLSLIHSHTIIISTFWPRMFRGILGGGLRYP